MSDQDSKPAALVFSHFGMFCTDFERLKDFYTRVMGFAISDMGGGSSGATMCFMTRRPFEHHQLVIAGGRPADMPSTINQLGFAAPDLAELRSLRGRLAQEDGVSDVTAVDHGISWTLYFLDPNRNRISVSVDTPWYVPQPACWPLDLDADDAAIAAETEKRVKATAGAGSRADWRAGILTQLQESGRLMPQEVPSVDPVPADDAPVFKYEAESKAPSYPRLSMRSIGIYANDLAKLEEFYCRVLGYIATGKGKMGPIGSVPESDYIYLTRDPDQFAQIVLCGGRAAGSESSVQQLTFRVPNFDELRRVEHLLRDADGVSRIVTINHGNSFSIYCVDPEGNRLELSRESEWYIPAPSSWKLDLSLSDDDILRTTEEKVRGTEGFMMRADWKARARSELAASGKLETA